MLVLVWIATTQSIAQPTVITDPAQITSKQKFDIQPFTVEKLYMTRAVGDSSWSPDDKQVAFVYNITGRHNIWVV
jgi:Tol biopolymer transport system component